MILDFIFKVAGGLGLFLLGMRQMSGGLQAIAGDSLRRIIDLLTSNRFTAVGVGLVLTAVIQCSSVTSVMVVGFVNAGLMNLTQAIGVILGANIGTTVTSWIIAIKITKYALPMIAVGAFVYLFSKREKPQLYGQTLYGLGMVFLGLALMKDGFAPLRESAQVMTWLHHFGAADIGSLILTVVVGTGICMLIQSSSAFIGIIMAMSSTGLLDFESSVALVLAANIGTTITAQLAAFGTNVHARRAARAHMIFNVVAVILTLLVFRHFTELIDYLVPEDPNLALTDGSRPYIMTHIAMATTIFNIAFVVLFLPFVGQLAAVVSWLLPDHGKQEQHLVLLDHRFIETPALALEQARREIIKMSGVVKQMLDKGVSLFLMESGRTTAAREIFALENAVDDMQKEYSIFLAKLLQAALTREESTEARQLIRISDELESIGDFSENLAKCYVRAKKNGGSFSPAARGDIERIARHVTQFYDSIIDAFRKRDTTLMPEIKARGEIINILADQIRDNHLMRLDDGTCDALSGLIFSDVVVALRRVKNHSFNIAEAVAMQK